MWACGFRSRLDQVRLGLQDGGCVQEGEGQQDYNDHVNGNDSNYDDNDV